MATPPKNINYQQYLRIIRKARARQPLTSKELAYVVEFKQDVDTGALDKVKDTEAFKKLSPEEQADLSQQALDSSVALLFQDPTYKNEIIDLAKEVEKGKTSEKIATGLNIALAGTDILTSIGQVKSADQATRRSRRPSHPAPLTPSPELANAITQAQSGNYDAVRALAPAQLALLDNYLSDLNVAKTASTGQAGTYGALGQVASNRRNRGAVELAPVGDAITARNQSRLDNLLGMKLNENANIQQSQSQFYPQELNQYQLEQQAAGQLGSTGRTNLRESLTGLGQFLPQTIAEISTNNRYNDIYNRMNGYPEFQHLAAKTSVDNSHRMNNWTNLVDPQYLDQLYSNH